MPFFPFRAVPAAVFLPLVIAVAVSADARSRPARDVVALECRAAEADLPGACRALKEALRDRVPGAVQRVMDDLSDAPTRPGDLALALRIDGDRARLDWRRGADALRPGPTAPLRAGADAGALVRRLLEDLPDTFR